ncbi:hypothetical protein [Nitrososphaera sp.]|uniref:hypothetical protein n=1 Tax=Nitrososphaera sp. TaxID=1971748 RepID=UPI0017B003F2|nr:hypothetical protein [Nitrososphaera sp.]NWG38096.1 hypothetical protein [Nitrososphaera sp.]
MSAEKMAMEEYEWALSQARVAHGEVKKWIVYAGEQLEMAGFPKDKISAKLRNDLQDFSADYISQICGPMGWTDRRFSPEVEQTKPETSSAFSERQDGAAEEPDRARCEKENQPYIDHLQKKIEFLQEVQKKLRGRPFLSLLDKKQYDEYILLADRAEKLAREAWDARQTIPAATQFYLAQIVAVSTIKHGASEYVSKVKELFSLTSKQVTKTLKGVVRDVHFLYEPTNRAEALMDGFYGKPCEKCASWRVKWENGICHCFKCDSDYRAKAERLPLARDRGEWEN